ncbi:MAG: hypothetical protein HYY17_01190 [Planctomycetes bacterium]|nr:hypothetical protein [Planctomycetota bacterium]
MNASTVGIRGCNIIAELPHTFALRSFRARDLETFDPVTLHLFDRGTVARVDLLAVQSELPRYVELHYPRLVRLRRIRADGSCILVETDSADGERLDGLLAREGRLDPGRALRIAEDLLLGLVAGEMRGLVHGAIGPSVVVVDAEGRAALDGFGFGTLLPGRRGSYGTTEERHARDVDAVVALLRLMADIAIPHDAGEPAGGVLARVRAAMPATPAAAPEPSVLDVVEPPPPAPKRDRLEGVRRALRRVASGVAWPVAAAAVLAIVVAVLFAGPFLGGDGRDADAVARALPLPEASPLAAGAAERAARPAERTVNPLPEPARRSPFELLRERVVALAEIGEYREALETVEGARDWTPEQAQEERDAVLAKAEARFRETQEVARAFASQGGAAQAEREWDAMAPFWPTAELRKRAAEERAGLPRLAEESRERKARLDRERARLERVRRFRTLLRRTVLDEGRDCAGRIRDVDGFLSGLDDPDLREEAQALRQLLEWEREFLARAREIARARVPRVRVRQISTRFGNGDIVALDPDAVAIARPGAEPERVPLARLTGAEKYALFGRFRRAGTTDAAGLAVMCLSWGLRGPAWEEAQAAGMPDAPLRLIRRILSEEEP